MAKKKPAAAPFWNWFVEHEPVIRTAYDANDSDTLFTMFDEGLEWVDEEINWETGPYGQKLRGLALVPTSREGLHTVLHLVSAAPTVDGWKFFAGRPPLDMNGFTINFGELIVDASRWHFELTPYDDGETVDVGLYALAADTPPKAVRELGSKVFVESSLGDLLYWRRVGAIDFHVVRSESALKKHTPFLQLLEHFQKVAKLDN